MPNPLEGTPASFPAIVRDLAPTPGERAAARRVLELLDGYILARAKVFGRTGIGEQRAVEANEISVLGTRAFIKLLAD
jgi:hypothetical protein